MQARVDYARAIRVAFGGIFGQFYTDSRGVGDDQESIFQLERAFDDLALGREIFAQRVLLQGKVGDAGGKLDTGSSADGTERVVWHNADMVCFGERGDLFAVADATGEADIGAHILDGSAAQQGLKFVDGV